MKTTELFTVTVTLLHPNGATSRLGLSQRAWSSYDARQLVGRRLRQAQFGHRIERVDVCDGHPLV